jgi:hypothetical protein
VAGDNIEDGFGLFVGSVRSVEDGLAAAPLVAVLRKDAGLA